MTGTTSPGLLDQAIQRAAVHGVISHRRLVALGLSRHAIEHRVRRGRLHRVHRGVFAVGHPRLTREGVWLAAVLAAGPGAALSHGSAAELWGITRAVSPLPEVSVQRRRSSHTRSGMTIHRPSALPPAAVTRRRQIPVTKVPRTLVDQAGPLADEALLELVGESVRCGRVDLATLHRQLTAVLEARPTSGKVARLRGLLDVHVPELRMSESELERRFMTLCARHGIALPDQQVWIGRARVDFRWSAHLVIVEVDGFQTHGTIAAMNADYARQRKLTLAGHVVLRFTWADVVHRPGRTADEVAQALGATA